MVGTLEILKTFELCHLLPPSTFNELSSVRLSASKILHPFYIFRVSNDTHSRIYVRHPTSHKSTLKVSGGG